MEKIFARRRPGKGFTLAELLIVVAIIAILAAIAAPLFAGALDKAKEAAFNANKRAVRAVAVNELLTDWAKYSNRDTYPNYETDGWKVTADISASGDITVEITDGNGAVESAYKEDADTVIQADGSYKGLVVVVTEVKGG